MCSSYQSDAESAFSSSLTSQKTTRKDSVFGLDSLAVAHNPCQRKRLIQLQSLSFFIYRYPFLLLIPKAEMISHNKR